MNRFGQEQVFGLHGSMDSWIYIDPVELMDCMDFLEPMESMDIHGLLVDSTESIDSRIQICIESHRAAGKQWVQICVGVAT